MPESIRRSIAKSKAASVGPPRLRFATAGMPLLFALLITYSIPLIIDAVSPNPKQSRTRTGTICTPGATPTVFPPIVPATWVPWP